MEIADIKPENFFLTKSGIVKIGDFGVSKKLTETRNFKLDTFVGTPCYMAPEIFCSDKYHKPVDIYSLGICLFEMLTFDRPFKYKDILDMANFGNIKLRIPKYVNEFYTELLNSMIVMNSENRLEIDEIVKRLTSYLEDNQKLREN